MSALRKSKSSQLATTSSTKPTAVGDSDTTNSLTENSSRPLFSAPISTMKSSECRNPANEIEAMNDLLIHMQQESAKRIEMLKFVFDKTFEEKIKNCINTSAEMEARAAAFEALIQSETLIKKPIKEITIENSYEDEFGMDFSQTGSTSEGGTYPSPPDIQTSENGAIPSMQPSACAADATSPKKADDEQFSTDHPESPGKKRIKGIREAALTKMGHWGKNAFHFFRAKNPGKETEGGGAGTSRKVSERTSRMESSDRSDRNTVKMQADLSRISRGRTRRTRKDVRGPQTAAATAAAVPAKILKPKTQRTKQSTQKASLKQKELAKMKTTVKLTLPARRSESDELKKRAAKLREAKKRMIERNAKWMKNKPSEKKGEKAHSYRPSGRRGFEAVTKNTKKKSPEKKAPVKRK